MRPGHRQSAVPFYLIMIIDLFIIFILVPVIGLEPTPHYE